MTGAALSFRVRSILKRLGPTDFQEIVRRIGDRAQMRDIQCEMLEGVRTGRYQIWPKGFVLR